MRSGDLVANRFEIRRQAGAGGMATVYQALDRETNAAVALKVVRIEASERFEREARLLQELDHPGIVRYVAHGSSPDGPFLVMEWLDGEDLKQRLARGPLTLAESVGVVRCAAAALAAAHARNIIHRDIKPANLWLVGGDPSRVKVLDFGIARTQSVTQSTGVAVGADGATHRTEAGALVGTPAYMAPEQVRGASQVDARADIYSLGCVLFRCLTGRTPFVAEEFVALLAKTVLEDPPRLGDLFPESPFLLDELVARMLAKDPADRPPNATALVQDLDVALDTSVESVRPSIESGALTGGEQRLASVILFRAGDAIADARPVVESFGGRIEAMIGGSAVVLLEGQDAATDEARRAAACALALRDATGVETMALATGRAQLGRVPIGDVVDRAAALFAEGPSGIRVADVTASLLGDDFDAHGGVLTGRKHGDQVRTLLGKPTPTVGREPELGRLDGIFTECIDEPSAHAVLVTGPAGIGKSRVRYELLRRLQARKEKVEVWIARGDPVGARSAFGLVAQIVRRAAGVLEGEPLEIRQQKLRARVARHVAEKNVERVTCFLCETIGAPFAETGNVVLQTARRDARVMFDQLRMAWEDFVGAECDAHPVVIVLEDLHWGDLPTVTLCDSALRLFSDKPLLVLAFARPEVTEQFPDLWKERAIEQLALRELSKRAAEKLVGSALGDRATPDIAARIVERAAGNAFYLEELIRATAEGRTDTPETALLMVQSRLESMEPEARRVLRAASIFGRSFWSGGVTALVGTAAKAAKWLRTLEEREIVEQRGDSKLAGEKELVFRHALVQEAAHAMLTAEDKVLGHKLAAEWLATHGESDAASLAEHWEHAGEKARAMAMWHRAAEQALEGNDYAECIARAERGAACGAEGEALGRFHLLRARANNWRGDNPATLDHAEQAMGLLPDGTDEWASAVALLATAYRQVGRPADLGALGEQLVAMLAGGSAVVAAAARVADNLLLGGRREAAERLLGALEGAAGTITNPTTKAWLEHARALNALFSGRSAEFVERYSVAVQAYLEGGDVRTACQARLNVGYGLAELGLLRDSERTLREVIVEADRLGLENVITSATHNLGWTLHRLGRRAEALAAERSSVERFEARGDRRLEGASRFYLAAIHLGAGDVRAAEVEARRAAAIGESASRSVRACALGVLSEILRQKSQADEALIAAREANEWVDAHGVDEGEALVRLAYAEALESAGHHEEATRAIARAKERLLERAAAIHREDWREAFLKNLYEHSRTLELAGAWLGGG